MTCSKGFGLLTMIIYSFIGVGFTDPPNKDILRSPSNAKIKIPFVVILPKNGKSVKQNRYQFIDDEETQDITPEVDSLDPPYDQQAYLLYHALRTTEELENIDQEAANKFERTKDILRQTLRKRCDQLKSCYRKCPKKVYITCTVECKESYDDFDVCQPKKEKNKCNKPKCGQTRPPNWLLRQ